MNNKQTAKKTPRAASHTAFHTAFRTTPRTTPARQASVLRLRKKVLHHTKKLLVPHKSNQYRPQLIRGPGLVAVLMVAIMAQVLYGFVTTGHVSVLGQAANIQTSDLLAFTNKARQAEGLADLQLNDSLSQAAFLKAQDMLEMQYWAHTSPSGVQPWKWFGDVGYNYSYAGENLAKNYPTAQATVSAWMDSTTHRENILNTHYVDVGFAVVQGTLDSQNTTLVVALYGAPVTAAVQATNTTRDAGTGFLASTVGQGSSAPWAYIGSAMRSLSPVTVAILILLAVVAVVGIVAHRYRQKLPKSWQKSWRVHHGLYTFVGMLALGTLVIIASNVGSL